jgi:hypothetical protein
MCVCKMGAMKKRENKTTLNVKILSKKVCHTKIYIGDVQVFILCSWFGANRPRDPTAKMTGQYNKNSSLLYTHNLQSWPR